MQLRFQLFFSACSPIACIRNMSCAIMCLRLARETRRPPLGRGQQTPISLLIWHLIKVPSYCPGSHGAMVQQRYRIMHEQLRNNLQTLSVALTALLSAEMVQRPPGWLLTAQHKQSHGELLAQVLETDNCFSHIAVGVSPPALELARSVQSLPYYAVFCVTSVLHTIE